MLLFMLGHKADNACRNSMMRSRFWLKVAVCSRRRPLAVVWRIVHTSWLGGLPNASSSNHTTMCYALDKVNTLRSLGYSPQLNHVICARSMRKSFIGIDKMHASSTQHMNCLRTQLQGIHNVCQPSNHYSSPIKAQFAHHSCSILPFDPKGSPVCTTRR
jgi:hypothetical protein